MTNNGVIHYMELIQRKDMLKNEKTSFFNGGKKLLKQRI